MSMHAQHWPYTPSKLYTYPCQLSKPADEEHSEAWSCNQQDCAEKCRKHERPELRIARIGVVFKKLRSGGGDRKDAVEYCCAVIRWGVFRVLAIQLSKFIIDGLTLIE